MVQHGSPQVCTGKITGVDLRRYIDDQQHPYLREGEEHLHLPRSFLRLPQHPYNAYCYHLATGTIGLGYPYPFPLSGEEGGKEVAVAPNCLP